MFQVEDTPNPNALKFVFDHVINPGPTRSYLQATAAADDPLAQTLFGVGPVTSVMIVGDFVTVNKTPSARWSRLRPKIETVLQEHLQQQDKQP